MPTLFMVNAGSGGNIIGNTCGSAEESSDRCTKPIFTVYGSVPTDWKSPIAIRFDTANGLACSLVDSHKPRFSRTPPRQPGRHMNSTRYASRRPSGTSIARAHAQNTSPVEGLIFGAAGGRVAPGFVPGALPRSGLGDFHHPAPPPAAAHGALHICTRMRGVGSGNARSISSKRVQLIWPR
jgi:hypothetical protein